MNIRWDAELFLWVFAWSVIAFPVQGELHIESSPISSIRGNDSLLKRPEGIAFFPGDTHVAIANSEGNSISVYSKKKKSSFEYEQAPVFSMVDQNLLYYVHDLDVSPCGNFIGTVSRDAASVAIFKKTNSPVFALEPVPHWQLRATKDLDSPTSIVFSPLGNEICICNRKSSKGILCFSSVGKSPQKYLPQKYSVISWESMAAEELSHPHGLAYSPDGKYLACLHKPFFRQPKEGGKSALVIYERAALPLEGFSERPAFISFHDTDPLHSIAFHPSGKYIAATHEHRTVFIFERTNDSAEYILTSNFRVKLSNDNYEIKGIAFSNDGKLMAVTTDEPSIMFYLVNE